MKNTRLSRTAAFIIGSTMLCIPALASAQTASSTITDVQSQIQALLAQLKLLEQQLMQLRASSTVPYMPSNYGNGWQGGMMGSTTPPAMRPCPIFNRNLSMGSQGDDVKQLQQTLADSGVTGFSETSVTGFFGAITAKALGSFQQMFGVSSSTNGFFGPITRDFIGRHCGEMGGKGEGNGRMMGSTTMPWMPGQGDDGDHGTWMMGSTTGHMPPPPGMMGSTTGNHGGGDWHMPPQGGQGGYGRQQGSGMPMQY